MRKLLLATMVAFALPPVASAGNVAMVARDVPLGSRSLQAASPPMRFNMLGVHWRGPGAVEVRTRSLRGAWRAWQDVDDDARPDEASAERARGVRDGNLLWTGASDAVQFRTHGRVGRLRAFYLWSRVTTAAARHMSIAGSPAIVPRSGWFADEKILRAKPLYAPALRYAVVHHTAGTNAYTPAQSAAIVRGIEVYHVKGNGWNDIGYNFLVDRYGTVYEGRGGGIERSVIGAHAEGFNTGSVGVAMIGNFAAATPPVAQQDAVANLLAWRLDVAHVDPLSKVVVTSGGNAKYRAGKVVTLRAVSGHRDTGPSECPGARAYRLLPSIAQRVSRIGLPKLYSPTAVGALGGPIRFQARLSSVRAWTVTVADAKGNPLAQGTGRGALVDWTWSSTGAGKGPFKWTMDAGAAVRPATGTLGKGAVTPPPASLSGLAAVPTVLSPNADGSGGVATISFTLGSASQVIASVADWNGGAPIPVFTARLPAGPGSFQVAAGTLPDGRYTLLVTAKPTAGKAVSQQLELIVDRTLGSYAAGPGSLSPNADGVSDTLTFSFALAREVPVRVEIKKAGAFVASVFAGSLAAGPHVLSWDGSSSGVRVADGTYDAVVTVTVALGDVPYSLPFAIDTVPPVLTLLDTARLRFQLSEPATLALLVNGASFEYAAPRGAFTVPWTGGTVVSVSAQARDAAGNVSPIAKFP
jgi:N-acetylmuramoyl-L-alanine amidase/FlgD Ig-like domain